MIVIGLNIVYCIPCCHFFGLENYDEIGNLYQGLVGLGLGTILYITRIRSLSPIVSHPKVQ